MAFCLTNRTLTNVTTTLLSISLEAILTHHYMPTRRVDHGRFVIEAKLTLLLIVILIIWCNLWLWFCLLDIWLVDGSAVCDVLILYWRFQLFSRLFLLLLFLLLDDIILIKRKCLKQKFKFLKYRFLNIVKNYTTISRSPRHKIIQLRVKNIRELVIRRLIDFIVRVNFLLLEVNDSYIRWLVGKELIEHHEDFDCTLFLVVFVC